MTLIKAYDIQTGNVETVHTVDLPNEDPSLEKLIAARYVADFVSQPNASADSTVYYISE